MNITNDILAEAVMLERNIKKFQKRVDEIKAACREKGSFLTKEYVCSVSTQTRCAYQVPASSFTVVRIHSREVEISH